METPQERFERRFGRTLEGRLGIGRDGSVWHTTISTAVKFFEQPENYERERAAYLVLMEAEIDTILGHSVPQLIMYDDELLLIEMTIVEPPFLLDFASAYPEEEAPDFPPDVWDQWMLDKAEEFGDRWFDVLRVRAEFLKQTGLVLMDVNPGNIKFE